MQQIRQLGDQLLTRRKLGDFFRFFGLENLSLKKGLFELELGVLLDEIFQHLGQGDAVTTGISKHLGPGQERRDAFHFSPLDGQPNNCVFNHLVGRVGLSHLGTKTIDIVDVEAVVLEEEQRRDAVQVLAKQQRLLVFLLFREHLPPPTSYRG